MTIATATGKAMIACPLCDGASDETPSTGDRKVFRCHNCGPFQVSGSLLTQLRSGQFDRNARAVLSYAVRRMQRSDGTASDAPLLTGAAVVDILKGTQLASPDEAIGNLIGWVAAQGGIGLTLPLLPAHRLSATLGVVDREAVVWVIQAALDAGFINGTRFSSGDAESFRLERATLTPLGWRHHAESSSNVKAMKRAFMAMAFGDPIIMKAYTDCFRPAALRCGYDLRILSDGQSAGLIDDRLRTELRTSRFVIADETHANRGAYWEAGFAEGLGRPVIYTCRKDHWEHDDKNIRPHFDTNHYLHVVWEPEDLKAAEEAIVAVIRATLPAEAVLTDD